MARVRTYKPEFFTSEDVSVLPFRARLTWLGLWPHCDDHGRFKDQVKLIKANVWPLDDVSLKDIEEDLGLLAAKGRIVRYTVGGVRYLAVQNWHRHQRINRPGRPKFPAPPVPIMAPEPGEDGHCLSCWETLKAHGTISEPSLPVDNSEYGVIAGQPIQEHSTEESVSTHGGLTPEGKGKEGKGREGARATGHATSPPPPRCPQHINEPTTDPCRACGDARKVRSEWDNQQADLQRAHRLAASRCPHCDAEGRRWHPDGKRHGTVGPCDHQPPQRRQEPA